MNEKKNTAVNKAFALAIQNHKNNNLGVAERLYNEVLKINPNHVNSIFYLGTIFAKNKNFDQAKQLLQKAIKINPNNADAHNNLGIVFKELGEHSKAIICYEKAVLINPNNAAAYNNLGNLLRESGKREDAMNSFKKALQINPDLIAVQANISSIYISQLDNLDKAISTSHKTHRTIRKSLKFNNQRISLYRLKHDVQQAEYLNSKNYKINGIDKFQKIGNKILKRVENKNFENNIKQKILLNEEEINYLLPFFKESYIYQTLEISEDCINPTKNWKEVEEQYFNSPNQIIYIDDFLSDKAIEELREFCLVSKIWNIEYKDKYLGAFSDQGFISPIHLQIAIELKKKMPLLFGKHKLGKFWAFKYDSTLGKGINIHADFAVLNLNFWITPDVYNNNKNSGGLKIYDIPAPENWTFQKYNKNSDEIYKYLNNNSAKFKNIPYKFNRAVLFNSDYFYETDYINFKDGYESRRINVTYLFGNRLVKNMLL